MHGRGPPCFLQNWSIRITWLTSSLMNLESALTPALTPVRSRASSPPTASPVESNTSPWSAAVGGAKNGKSGRVIERLMGENDRLQREKTLATAKFDEELKRSESARSAVESLRATNQYLNSMHESDAALLAKRERKVEELREELENERLRRERAEREVKETRDERDRMVQDLTQEVMEERELARRSATQYDVLQRSWKTQGERYDGQIHQLKASIEVLREMISEDKQKLAQLDVITEQMGQEGDKSKKIQEDLAKGLDAYKDEREQEIGQMRARAERNDQGYQRLLRDVTTVLQEMRYIVNLRNDMRPSQA